MQRLGVLLAHLTQPCQPSPEGSPGRPAHRPFRGLLACFPCCVRFPCVHAAATTPVQRLGVLLAHLTRRVSLPRKGHRVGLHIVLFEACSAFTRVAACTLARSPIRDPLSEGFRHFVSSMPAPIASGWSESPGGACTHWKAPPCHGAHPKRPFSRPRWWMVGGLRSGHPCRVAVSPTATVWCKH